MKRRSSAPSCPAFAAPDTRSSWSMTAPATAPATSRCSQARSSSGIRSTSDRARRPRDLLATEPNGARVRDPAPDRAEPPALCRGAREHRVQCLFAGQGSTHHRCADHPDRSVCAEALPMIAQLLLTAFLALVLVYAWSAHRTVPIIGLLAGGAALAGLYFVSVPEHATALAAFAGIGRGSDLIVYTSVVIRPRPFGLTC